MRETVILVCEGPEGNLCITATSFPVGLPAGSPVTVRVGPGVGFDDVLEGKVPSYSHSIDSKSGYVIIGLNIHPNNSKMLWGKHRDKFVPEDDSASDWRLSEPVDFSPK